MDLPPSEMGSPIPPQSTDRACQEVPTAGIWGTAVPRDVDPSGTMETALPTSVPSSSITAEHRAAAAAFVYGLNLY